ncbi:MAG: caspase family protein [bacterium]
MPLPKPPKLAFDYALSDQNNDKILDGGENISLKVTVKNQGEGIAQGVKVLLSGESKALNHLGREKYLGEIPSGVEKEAVFEAVLPYKVEPDEGDMDIKVTEERGFGSLEVKRLRVAMQPAKESVTTDTISVLVDVDQPLSPSSLKRDDAYAVIIGITDYRSNKIPEIKYAKHDVETVKEYLTNICGIPEENIMMLTDDKATLSDLTAYIEERLARNVSKNSFVFVYFAGHGTPNPETGDAYLVPYDGEPGFISKLYPLSRFYGSLEKLPTENIVVALDACFSGAGGRSLMAEGKRPLTIAKLPAVGKKAAVITASAADEISQDLDQKRH